jgi:hypothetical protein
LPIPPPPHQQDEIIERVSPSESVSTDTSADSTPLQTPTQDYPNDSDFLFGKSGHDVTKNVLVHDDEPEEERRESWGGAGSLQMQDGFPATFVPMMKMEDSRAEDACRSRSLHLPLPPLVCSRLLLLVLRWERALVLVFSSWGGVA